MESPPLAACDDGLRLALYSDQVIAANRSLDLETLRLIGRAAPRIGYLSSAPDLTRRFFNEKRAYYARYGAIDLSYFDAVPLDPEEKARLLACDAIQLTGGDTRGYLARLRRAALIEPLRHYALAGRPLIGTSAGAILMTPGIAVNALFESAAPEASSDEPALALLPFEFFPHLQADPTYLPRLIRYSRRNGGRPIFACADGSGLMAEGGMVRAFGAVTTIRDGDVRPG